MELHLQRGTERRKVQVHAAGDSVAVRLGDDAEHEVRIVEAGRHSLLLELDGRRHRVRWASVGSQLHLQLRGQAMRFVALEEEEAELESGDANPIVRAPMPGKVIEVLVSEGETVKLGQPVVRVEAMKMEVDLPAGIDGVVAKVHVTAGQIADPEAPLVTLAPHEGTD